MSDAELRRLRRDIEAIEQAAGLRRPALGWPDVWLALALAASGAALAAWAEFGPAGRAAWGLAPSLAVALAGAARWASRWRRDEGRRRERAFEVLTTCAVVAGLAGLIAWERALALPTAAVRGAGLYLVGVAMVPLALSAPGRRVALAASVALVPFGLAIPALPRERWAAAGGLAMAGAGLAAAGIVAWQLRGRPHGVAD